MGATETGLARIAGILREAGEDLRSDLDRMDRIDWLRGLVAKREATCARLADAIARASAQSRASQCINERMQISARLKRLRSASIRAAAGLNRARALLHAAGASPMNASYLAAEERYLSDKRGRLGTSIIFTGD